MRTGITSLADALVSVSVMLTAAIFCAGPACAAPSQQDQQDQQDQFVELLEQDQVPLVDNLPALVARAHQICKELNGGASVYTVVDEEMNGIYADDPALRQQAARVHRTAIRFIAVSAEVYCPSHLSDAYISDDVGFASLAPAAGARRQT